ncbi:MAG: redoxin domain-containing protein [Friedmanniella sp.]
MPLDDPLLGSAGDRELSPHDSFRAETRPPAEDTNVLRPVESSFSLSGATGWLNSSPLGLAELRGRVVLVSFWTYTCINWLRSLPHLRAWDAFYRRSGLVVIGVHSPEFSFERDVDNVAWAADALAIDYPIAIDNRFAVWRSFDNHYWPALYLVDTHGRLRHQRFGEEGYEETETVIRQLLDGAGAADVGGQRPVVDARGVEAPADWGNLRSGETYLGYDRTSGFASGGGLVPDEPHEYAAPARLRLGNWAISGTWTVGGELAALPGSPGRLSCRFHARDVHLVAAPLTRGSTVGMRVLLDGHQPGPDHGVDIDAAGRGVVSEPRLYQLIRQSDRVADHTVEIDFEPGVGVYALTFG